MTVKSFNPCILFNPCSFLLFQMISLRLLLPQQSPWPLPQPHQPLVQTSPLPSPTATPSMHTSQTPCHMPRRRTKSPASSRSSPIYSSHGSGRKGKRRARNWRKLQSVSGSNYKSKVHDLIFGDFALFNLWIKISFLTVMVFVKSNCAPKWTRWR